MLAKVKLGGREYRRIYEEAQKLIPMHSSSWTNWNQSDPGITVLQSFALLSSELDKAAETVSEEDAVRLLELFGFPRAFAQPALLTLFLAMKEREILLCGTPFLLRDTHFELEHESTVQAGVITKILYTQDGREQDVSGLIHAKSRLELFEGGGDGPVFIDITFSHCAKKGERLRLYFESDAKFPRNKASGGGLPFAVIAWEILGKNGYVTCEAVDGTSCFTQSGAVEITLLDDMSLQNGGYHVRAVISHHDYDVRPLLSRIWGGHAELVQKRTLSRCVSFDLDETESLAFPLPFWNAENSDILVLGRDEKGYFRQYYPAGSNNARVYSATKENGMYTVRIQCEKMPREGKDSVRIIVRRSESLSDLELGSVTGYDGQSFLPEWCGEFPAEGAKLMLKQLYGNEIIYEDVDESRGNVFCELSADGEVTVKHAATDGDNMLFFSQLSLTLGEKGNLTRKSLGKYSPGGFGGKNPGDADDGLAALTGELEFPYIAVTLSDYERLALETPGLSLESASARRTEAGTVQIAVKSYSDNPRPGLSALQTRAIAGYLEERRILNSNIEIIPPDWVPVEIEVNVSVYPQAVSPEKQISDAILGGIRWGEFEAVLSYGKVHALLDGLGCVEAVSRLKIRTGREIGDNIRQEFNTIFYLEDLSVNYETRV